MFRGLFVVWLLTAFQIGFAQQLTYDISVSGISIGELSVSRDVDSTGNVIYKASTDVVYRIFSATHLEYNYKAVFSKEELIEAIFVHHKDEVKREFASLERTSSGYQTNLNGKKRIIQGVYTSSMTQLYFDEPVKMDPIFSERYHAMVSVEKLEGDRRYLMRTPPGDKNYYEYNKEGLCSKITVNMPLLKFEIELVNTALN